MRFGAGLLAFLSRRPGLEVLLTGFAFGLTDLADSFDDGWASANVTTLRIPSAMSS